MAQRQIKFRTQLNRLDKCQADILKKYDEVFIRAFQINYELKLAVTWERLYRLSPHSNFVMVIGSALIPVGTEFRSKIVEVDTTLNVSFTLPIDMLDNNATPYEIAETAQEVFNIYNVLDPRKFIELMSDENTTMDTLREFAPINVDESVIDLNPSSVYPYFLSSFNVDLLSDKQRESLKIYMMVQQ